MAFPRPPSFVGRDRELAAARALLEALNEQRGCLAIVGGVPGIGRTSFLSAVCDAATEARATVTTSGNYETVRSPLGPFAEHVAELAQTHPELVPPEAESRAQFERFFGMTSGVAPQADVDRRRLFVMLADGLIRVATRTPLVISIDDSQWLDPESLEFVHYFATRIGRSRIAMMLAFAHGDSERVAETVESLLRFDAATRFELPRLDDRAIAALIARLLPANRGLRPQTIEAICALVEGNPLFARELVSVALRDDGNITLPRSIELSARKSLRLLDPASRRIVEVAAVIGSRFTLDDVAEVARSPRGDVLAALRLAREAALLDEVRDRPGAFAFQNSLVRAAIYESLFVADRQPIHALIAALFERKATSHQVLAEHWRRAGDDERARYHSERAGDESYAIGAYGSARDRFLEFLETAAPGPERARVAEKAARSLNLVGDAVGARTALREAIEYANSDAPQRVAELTYFLSDIAYRCGDVEEAERSAECVAASVSTSNDLRYGARASLATYAVARFDRGRTEQQLALLEDVRDGRTNLQEIKVEWARACLAMLSGSDDAWRGPADASLRLAENAGEPAVFAMTALNYAITSRQAGRSDLARRAILRAIAAADENGLLLASAYARGELITQLYLGGRLPEAREEIRAVLVACVDAPLVRIQLAGAALPVLADLGLSEDARGMVDDELIEICYGMGEPWRFAELTGAVVYERGVLGRTDEARTLIARALPQLSDARGIGFALMVFARFGSAEHVAAVRRLFEADPGHEEDRVFDAVTEAIDASARRDVGAARSAAASAIVLAERRAYPLVLAFVDELCGRRAEAVARYRTCGASAHVARLSAVKALLTKREMEVAQCLREGLSNRAIARRLTLSERTVENHVASILSKTGAESRRDMIDYDRIDTASFRG